MIRAKTLAITCLALTLVSCENKTQTGALTGAGVGMLAGGLIGGGATGVVIGGAVGAAGGALVGAALDAQDRKNLEENAPQTLHKIDQKQELSVSDIEVLAKNNVSDDVIIGQIETTHSVFHLSADQIVELKNAGVSEKVIEFMIKTGKQ